MSIKWETPSESVSKRGKWTPVMNELRSRPGEWAVIAEDAAANLGPMLKRTYPGFEFTARDIKHGRAAKVYGRYIGDKEEKGKD